MSRRRRQPIATATTAGDTTAPTVPTNVAAAAQSSTSIQVTWTASTDNVSLAGYRVYRNGSTSILATVTNGTSYTDTGLTPGTAYSYQVRAFDTSTPPNVSALSTPAASATTPGDTSAPSVPGGVSATALSSSSIRIDWSASTDTGGAGLAGYRVFRNGSTTVLATVTSGTTYTDTGLTAATNYSYQLRAFDAATPANVVGTVDRRECDHAGGAESLLGSRRAAQQHQLRRGCGALGERVVHLATGVQLAVVLESRGPAAGAGRQLALVRGAAGRHREGVQQRGEPRRRRPTSSISPAA
jgi:chitodextrinase